MQKKIALINDVTGFGRCSIAVMAPIVSAMKIQAVTVPTAILSTHTQFPIFYFDDYTPRPTRIWICSSMPYPQDFSAPRNRLI